MTGSSDELLFNSDFLEALFCGFFFFSFFPSFLCFFFLFSFLTASSISYDNSGAVSSCGEFRSGGAQLQ
jgi:hypothetical protein